MAPDFETIKLRLDVPVHKALQQGVLDGDGVLARQIYRMVRRLATDLRLLPNQFLSENDVAASLAVSKTPVREAFIHLSEDGIVHIQPKSGTYIAPIDADRAAAGFFAWKAVESSCAAQVAERCTFGDIDKLRALVDRQAFALARDDIRDYRNAVEEFHDAVFDISDFPISKKLVDTAKFEVDRMRTVRLILGQAPAPDVVADASAVVDAISRRDADAAREGMARFLDREMEAVEAVLRDESLQEFFLFINRKKPGKRRPRSAKATAV